MGMYTDWGNARMVSCVAWLNGAGPGGSTEYQGNGRVGGVHFWLSPITAAVPGATAAGNEVSGTRLGVAGIFR